jgi:hypothetical protein
VPSESSAPSASESNPRPRAAEEPSKVLETRLLRFLNVSRRMPGPPAVPVAPLPPLSAMTAGLYSRRMDAEVGGGSSAGTVCAFTAGTDSGGGRGDIMFTTAR